MSVNISIYIRKEAFAYLGGVMISKLPEFGLSAGPSLRRLPVIPAESNQFLPLMSPRAVVEPENIGRDLADSS